MRLTYRRAQYHPGLWGVIATYRGVSFIRYDHSRMHAAYRASRQVLAQLATTEA